jgi:hypothetical protein
MKWLAGFVIAIAGLVGLYYLKYPVYSYRYRLTINIEIDGKVQSGSSVIEVGWQRGPPLGDAGGYGPIIRGQAPLVDLGRHGVVVATLITGDGYGILPGGTVGALWLVPRAFGDSTAERISDLPRLRGRRELEANNLPRLIWFSDPSDPTTAKRIWPQDIPKEVDPAARFAGASVEITEDAIIIDIRKKLPWLNVLESKGTRLDPQTLSKLPWLKRLELKGSVLDPHILSERLHLSFYMFVGANS